MATTVANASREKRGFRFPSAYTILFGLIIAVAIEARDAMDTSNKLRG